MDFSLYVNLISIFIAFSSLHGFFLSITLFLKEKKNKTAKNLFIFAIIIISLHLFEVAVTIQNIQPIVYYVYGTTFPILFLIAPVFYFYIKFTTDRKYSFRLYHLLHTIPFLIIGYINYPFIFAEEAIRNASINYWVNSFFSKTHLRFGIWIYIQLIVHMIQLTIYLIYSHKEIRKFENDLKILTSNSELITNLQRLKTYIKFFGIYTASYFMLFIFLNIYSSYFAIVDATWLFLISIFVAIIGYTVISQPDINLSIENNVTENQNNTQEKYKKSALPESDLQEIHKRLLQYLEEEKFYLNNKLTLADLSKKLDTSTNNLSQVFNRLENKNFYEFINELRIKECIDKMKTFDKNNDTILGLALDCGFNNKSSFNRSFKNIIGKTPSEYLKEINKGN